MHTILQDLRYALRALRRSPGFTTVAVLALALGIGANTAIFSLFEQVLLQPLPVHEPERLVNLSAPGPKPGSISTGSAGGNDVVFSYPIFRDLEAAEESFAGIAAHRPFWSSLATGEETFIGRGTLVSGSYFSLLGVRPALGRLLGPEDDRTVGGHPVVVLSHHFWESRLGADPGVLNQTITVNGYPLTIIGVAQAGFHGTTLQHRPELFVPVTMQSALNAGQGSFESRRNYWLYLFARLKPGIQPAQARERLNTLYHAIINETEVPLQEGMSEETLARFRAKEIVLEDGRRGQSTMLGDMGAPGVLLLGITGVVLLIACANVANLLLARGARRRTEVAVRASLGAGRARITRQLFTEALLLAVLGGAASLVIAAWTMSGIGALLPASIAAWIDFELRASSVIIAAVIALGAALLFGLYPALAATRTDLAGALKAGGGQPAGARAATRFRNTLTTVQIGLAMMLLVCAGLFIQSLRNVSRIDTGLQVEGLVAFSLYPELNRYAPAESRTLFERVGEELAAIPGVTGISSAVVPVLAGNWWGNDVSVEGFETGPDTDVSAAFNTTGPGYFRTLGIPLLAGRDFMESDDVGAPGVAIVNEAFTRKFGLDGAAAVGKRMAVGRGEELDLEIVGVVADAAYSDAKYRVPPMYFTPWRQDQEMGSLTFYARTATPPEQALASITALVRRLDPGLPVHDAGTMAAQLRENSTPDRIISTLAAAFAALATLLAALGLYGVMGYTVAQRTREIGVRMALGADGRRVRRMVLKQMAWMTTVGGAFGVAAALMLGRAARSLLFEVAPHDPRVLAATVVLLALVALGASYLPARRATLVDPTVALRAD
jgi:predicted permease